MHDGRKIKGPLSAIVYLQGMDAGKAHKHLLHKRQKGELGGRLDTLVYVRSIEIGKAAYQKGVRRAAAFRKKNSSNLPDKKAAQRQAGSASPVHLEMPQVWMVRF